MIQAYINKQRQVLIDPTVVLNSNNNTYEIQFQFQSKLPSGYAYYLVVKPIFDIPQRIALDDKLRGVLPSLNGFYGDKLGIGLLAIKDGERYATNYYYVPLKTGADNNE